MLFPSGASRGNDGDAQRLRQLCQGFVGIAVLHAVVIHRGEQNLSGTTLLHLLCPIEKSEFHTLASALHIAMPPVVVEPCINGTDAHLRAKAAGNLVDELWAAYGCRIDAHLVGTGIEQPLNVFQGIDATAHGEGDVDFLSHACHHLGEGLSSLKRCGDVEENQFIGTLLRVGLAQFNGVARLPEVDEVGAFHRLTVFHVQAGHYAFC